MGLDANSDSCLDKTELRRFAQETGFGGSDEEWDQEFLAQCPSGQGLTLADFSRLVNDSTDDGCYCSDEELQAILSKLNASSASHQQIPVPEEAMQPGLAEILGHRNTLIAGLFVALDVNGDKCLDKVELRVFAQETGFDGGDKEWEVEFRALCPVGAGLNLAEFAKLVNDNSDDGCYCSDEELQGMIARLDAAPTAVAVSNLLTMSATQTTVTVVDTYGDGRSDLIRDVFTSCDTNRDGCLDKAELRVFAQETGFDGRDEDWESEFRALCPSGPGLNLADFTKLVNDNTDDGCYCTDDELQAMLMRLRSDLSSTQVEQSQVQPSACTAEQPPPPGLCVTDP
eukprot:630102-Amphidinium_carterae.1